MHNLGLAMMQYAQDYDERYCLPYSFDILLRPYLGMSVTYGRTTGVFVCPSDNVPRSNGGRPRSYAIAGAGSGLGPYGAVPGDNLGFAGPTQLAGANASCGAAPYCIATGRLMSEIPDAAGTLMLVECPDDINVTANGNGSVVLRPFSKLGSSCAAGNEARTGLCGQDMYQATSGGQSDGAHFEGWNYMFVDGHVKWLLPEKTVGAGINPRNEVWPYNAKGMWTIAAND